MSATPNLPIRRITIHCTDTPEGKPFSVADIRRMHLARGWSDIGYHYLIGLDGSIGLGRKESTIPAAVQGYNKGMLAIAYVGGMGADGKAKDTRTPQQKAALAKLVQLLVHKHNLAVDTVWGHRDYDHAHKSFDGQLPEHLEDCRKMCPCFDVSKERDAWVRTGEPA